jgi:hypothetical protein
MKLNTIQSVSSSAYTTNQFRHSTKSATSCRETVSIHSFYGLGSLTVTFSYHRDEILFTPICQFVYNLKCVVEEIFSDKVGTILCCCSSYLLDEAFFHYTYL